MKRIRTFENDEIFERIYDPDLGTGASSTEVVAKYKDDPDVFISFTAIDKLGINPNSSYETPIGIYTYPVKFLFENAKEWERYKHKPIGFFVPFAGNSPYVNIVRYVGREDEIIRDINSVSQSEVSLYLKRLQDALVEDWRRIPALSQGEFAFKTEDHVRREVMEYWELSKNGSRVNSLGGRLWYVLRLAAKDTDYNNRFPVRWNTIMRNMGLKAIVDLNSGIIHHNEQWQAVFLEKKALKVIDRIENSASAKKLTFNSSKHYPLIAKVFGSWFASVLSGESINDLSYRREIARKLLANLSLFSPSEYMSSIYAELSAEIKTRIIKANPVYVRGVPVRRAVGDLFSDILSYAHADGKPETTLDILTSLGDNLFILTGVALKREGLMEAEYQGKDVELDTPFRTPDGPKKFSVYVKNDKGNVVKVNFGDPDMEIKRDDPDRKAAYRARHGCDDPGPKWKANYWSCRSWSDNAPWVSESLIKEALSDADQQEILDLEADIIDIKRDMIDAEADEKEGLKQDIEDIKQRIQDIKDAAAE